MLLFLWLKTFCPSFLLVCFISCKVQLKILLFQESFPPTQLEIITPVSSPLPYRLRFILSLLLYMANSFSSLNCFQAQTEDRHCYICPLTWRPASIVTVYWIGNDLLRLEFYNYRMIWKDNQESSWESQTIYKCDNSIETCVFIKIIIEKMLEPHKDIYDVMWS